MTLYTSYKIINLNDFEALNLPSRKITANFDGIGIMDILITKGNCVSLLFDGVFLSLNLNNKNPFEFEDYAAFLDPDDNIWLGIKDES